MMIKLLLAMCNVLVFFASVCLFVCVFVRLTCEMLGELLLQLGSSVEGFPALLLRQTLVHLPAGGKHNHQNQ